MTDIFSQHQSSKVYLAHKDPATPIYIPEPIFSFFTCSIPTSSASFLSSILIQTFVIIFSFFPCLSAPFEKSLASLE